MWNTQRRQLNTASSCRQRRIRDELQCRIQHPIAIVHVFLLLCFILQLFIRVLHELHLCTCMLSSVSSVPYINCHISIQAQTELLQCILLYLFENKLVFVLFITYCSLHYLITVFEPGLWQEPQLQPGHKKQNTKSEKDKQNVIQTKVPK